MYRTNVSNAQEESLRDRKKIKRRHLILQAARATIASKGLISLKIRDIAQAADCSIGSIYNEFGDFDGVILEVSRETIKALGARVSAVPNWDPVEQLHGLADAYLGFAIEHANLLRALYEHRMENDRPFPDDLLQMVMKTFALMYEPMVRLLPDRDPVELPLEHPIFHCVYDLKEKPQIPGISIALRNKGTGITWEREDAKFPDYRAIYDDEGRIMVMICHNTDLGDGWEREGEDEWYFREFSEKKAYPLGINIVFYAMTH